MKNNRKTISRARSTRAMLWDFAKDLLAKDHYDNITYAKRCAKRGVEFKNQAIQF